jgi:1,4-dihydroxy-2-naphthoate octaprenyltransferase
MSKKTASFLKVWFIAIRPFALPVSTMPVIFGSLLPFSITGTSFNAPLFILALFAMVFLHSGANILSDINDHKKGLDKVSTPVSGAIVRGYISEKEALIGSLAFMAAGCSLGGIIVYFVGIPILVIAGIGIAIGVFYTVGPFRLKYHALGDLAVFLDFGTLGALGAWTVQTGSMSWVPVVWAVPLSLLVIAILHSNNWRDIASDEGSNVSTVASLLGDRGSHIYYCFLLYGAHGVILLLLIITRALKALKPEMPLTFVITLAAFPLTVKLIRTTRTRNSPDQYDQFVMLDAKTSKLNLFFDSLCIAALLIHKLTGV